MSPTISDVALATGGGIAILYGLVLALAVLSGRVGTDAIALGIGLLLFLEAGHALYAVAE